MSALTKCNRCRLDRMKERAKQRGVDVMLVTDNPSMPGWTGARYTDRDAPNAWFMELTDECICTPWAEF